MRKSIIVMVTNLTVMKTKVHNEFLAESYGSIYKAWDAAVLECREKNLGSENFRYWIKYK